MADRIEVQITSDRGAQTIACRVNGTIRDVTDPDTAAVIWQLSLNAADYLQTFVGEKQLKLIAQSLRPPWQSRPV